MIELRPYQREAVDAVVAAGQREVQHPAIGLPTGTGKTIIFSKLIEERGGQALVLAHRDELIQQAVEKYRLVDPTRSVGVVKAGLNDLDHPVVVASIQTLSHDRRLRQLPRDYKTVTVDEAHHAVAPSYLRVLRHLDESELILGVSATLERGDKLALGSASGGVWDEVVYLRTLQEMIRLGYLVDIRARAVRLNLAFGRLRSQHGDFVAGEAAEALEHADAPAIAVRAYLEHAPGRTALVFTPTVQLAHLIAGTFRHAGVAAEAVDGAMDEEERRGVIRRLREGQTKVVCNCAVLTEGFDEPSLDCIIVARPTRSRVLYMQMVGRGTRIHPGKQDLLVLDLVGNDERVDLVTLPRLLGLRPQEESQLAEKGAVELLASRPDEQALARAAAGLSDPSVQLTSREVNLFSRKNLNWLRLADGRWYLSLDRGEALTLEPRGALWAALHITSTRDGNDGRWRDVVGVLSDGLDLGYAMGVAEELLHRRVGDRAVLTDKTAAWRELRVSSKQLETLRKLDIPIPSEGLTKGQASDLISAKIASRRRPEQITLQP